MSITRIMSRLLGRLSVGRKLMLIYLLDLLAVIFISSILINEKFTAIDFARKEIAGNAYIDGVRDLLHDSALAGAGQPVPGPGLQARLAGLQATEAGLGEGLQTVDLNAALVTAVSDLASSTPDTRAAA